MSAAPSRLKQAGAPSGLMPAAPNLPAQGVTGRRIVASGIDLYSEDTQCRAWELA